jgi:hypothetical protein
MIIQVTRSAPKFDLAIGDEDGVSFLAIIWPEDLGVIPFASDITATPVKEGFVLSGLEQDESIAFLGVSESFVNEMSVRNIVILRPIKDGYEQKSVRFDRSHDVGFDFSRLTSL